MDSLGTNILGLARKKRKYYKKNENLNSKYICIRDFLST
jgi:hypothetical protein